jgi:hypothetical protein
VEAGATSQQREKDERGAHWLDTIPGFTEAATLPMRTAMATDQELGLDRVDAAIHFGALLARAAAYAFVFAIADVYDCGRAILTGVWLGDVVGHLVGLCWQWRDGAVQVLAELALLGLVFLLVRSQLVWPEELPLRAILGLAAFGVFTTRVGGTLFTVLGPSERGFA